MSLASVALPAFLAGLMALAAVLYVLQRLRVRHREVVVPTTLFWKEAVQETRARVFVQRFRHPWAYALVLLIAGLVWLAIAEPTRSTAGRQHVLVLDASAGMARGDLFAGACRALSERAKELPRERTRVVAAGAFLETLLECGEEQALLARRLEARKPDAAPASVERVLPMLVPSGAAPGGVAIEVFGRAPVSAAAKALLAGRAELSFAVLEAGPEAANHGVTALGAVEAESGAWNRVDVLVEVAGPSGAAAAAVAVLLDGQPLQGLASTATPAGQRLVARDVPARGGRVDVTVRGPSAGGDALPLDDAASLVLPNRAPIKVALSAGVPSAIREVLAVDGGAVLVDAKPDVVVRADGEPFFADAPALELVPDQRGPAFVVRRTAVRDPERALRESFELLGIHEIDSTDLATRAGRPIELVLEDADRQGVRAWASLFGPGYDFAQSRAFPLFLARTLRWLAEVPTVPFEAAAGEVVRDGSKRLLADGKTLDALGGELRLPRALQGTSERGDAVCVSLLDLDTTAGPATLAETAGLGAAESGTPPWRWLVLAALALLLLEWWLVRTERMP